MVLVAEPNTALKLLDIDQWNVQELSARMNNTPTEASATVIFNNVFYCLF